MYQESSGYVSSECKTVAYHHAPKSMQNLRKTCEQSYVTYTNEASGGPQHNQSRKPQSTNSQFVVHLLPLKSAQYTLLSHMHRNKSSLSTALQISGTWHNTLEEFKKLS
jgi:hypothetical protein